MPLSLEKRAAPSTWMMAASPFIALALTLIFGAIVFLALGKAPLEGLYAFFAEPLLDSWSLEETLKKATPLALIAAGLCICYRANVWNIGAEGQLVMGAVFGGAIPVLFPEWQSVATLPAMLLLGVAGGALYALIPAGLKVRFGANEILTSLMLVYVAELLLDWLVRGPWRNPGGYNFPESAPFSAAATMPLIGADNLYLGLKIVSGGLFLAVGIWRAAQYFWHRIEQGEENAIKSNVASRESVTLQMSLIVLSVVLAAFVLIIDFLGPIGDSLSIGLPIAIVFALFLSWALKRTIQGFSVLVAGEAPRAARFAGVDRNRLTLGVMALSGGLAGLAGVMEVAGPIGQLQPEVSPGYGFTAIIVAFLGRLNPIGAVLAAFLLSLTFIGGENAQIVMGVTDKITRVFQGVLLFFVLACDTMIRHRLVWRVSRAAAAEAARAAKKSEAPA